MILHIKNSQHILYIWLFVICKNHHIITNSMSFLYVSLFLSLCNFWNTKTKQLSRSGFYPDLNIWAEG